MRGDVTRATYPAAGVLYEGAMVQLDGSGNLINASGDGTTFVGLADNSTSAAADRMTIIDAGCVRLAGIVKGSSWTAADVGDTVYASDGATFSTVSSGKQIIGRVVEVESFVTTVATCWVQITGVTKRDPA